MGSEVGSTKADVLAAMLVLLDVICWRSQEKNSNLNIVEDSSSDRRRLAKKKSRTDRSS